MNSRSNNSFFKLIKESVKELISHPLYTPLSMLIMKLLIE